MSGLLNKVSDFLTVRNLTLQYKTGAYRVTAVNEVSFSCDSGERLILLGPSGCGKSTILKAIGGFILPHSGEIMLNGKQLTKPAPDRAVVFQEFDQLLPWKTALGNVIFAIRNTRAISRKAAEEEAAAHLQRVGLGALGHRYPHELSGGQKQRVAIARCLALRAEVILMDEPFASLDALTRQQMQEKLLGLWSEARFTLVFVTHSIDEALILGSRIVTLSPHPGRVIEEIKVRHCDDLARRHPEYAALKGRIESILFKDQLEYVI
ncbi:MAG: ABC transporter ATP-binding protein [Azoarcus sp.]|nr:ABC transporter ATP-binding protein [Azoarcus sp.]